jgi:hypothetical protein
VTCVSPAAAAGAVNVVLSTVGGTATATAAYTYQVAPTIVAVTPSSGPQAGGQTVTITGTSLVGTIGVTVGGTAATSVTVVSATTVTCVTSAGAVGAADVVLSTPSGSTTSTGGYSYIATPTISSIAPAEGPMAGGTLITITGTNLNGTTSVTFGGAAATAVTVVSATSVTCVTPAGAAGTATVALTTPGGLASDANAFTYQSPAGSGTAGNVTSGPIDGTGSGGTSSGCGLGAGGMGVIGLMLLALRARRPRSARRP